MSIKIKLSYLLLATTVLFGGNVYADCSTENKSDLLSCASNSVLACRNQFPSCNREPEQVISVQDVLEKASAKCCVISGKRKVARQKACIKVYELKYGATVRVAHSTLKPFLKAARKELAAFRRAGCSTGSN